MKPVVSVILPVYNAEEFLDDCITSILNQSYREFELIIVNDGSTDRSEEIIKQYLDSENIIYRQQANGGVSKARNQALSIASGEYVVFVDADDKLPNDSLSERIHHIKDSDLLIGSYSVINEHDEEVRRMPCSYKTVMNRNEVLKMLLSTSKIRYQGYLWNKLFKREIIRENNISFDKDVHYGEDRLFISQYLMYCKTIAVTSQSVYMYRVNNRSAMAALQNLSDASYARLITEFDGFEKLKQLLEKYDEDMYELCLETEMWSTITMIKRAGRNAPNLKKTCVKIGWKNIVRFMECKERNVSIKSKLKVVSHLVTMR